MNIIIQIPSILIIKYDRNGSDFDTTSLYDSKGYNHASDSLMNIIIQIPSILIIKYDRNGSDFDTTSLYDSII